MSSRITYTLGVLAVAFILVAFVRLLLTPSSALGPLWSLIVRLIRIRYAVVAILGPAILAIIAFGPAKSLLYGAFILRPGTISWLPGANWDLYCLTCLSILTVATGFAAYRVVELYGDSRFRPAEALIADDTYAVAQGNPDEGDGELRADGARAAEDAPQSPTASPPSEPAEPSSGWSVAKILTLLCLGLILPAACLIATLRFEAPYMTQPITAFGGVASLAAGVGAALATLLLLGFLQNVVLYEFAKPCGLLPFESLAWWPKGPPQIVAPFVKWLLASDGAGLGWFFRGPGYTDAADPNHRLYPGHSQISLIGLSIFVVYCCWYLSTTPNLVLSFPQALTSEWKSYLWPGSFYLVLAVFLTGWGMSALAFFFDRYGFAPEVVVLAWVAIMFPAGNADHYFRVFQDASIAESEAQSPADTGISADQLSPIMGRIQEARAADSPSADELEPIPVDTLFDDWTFPGDTLVIVTAAGGGIQSSAWTAKVLTELESKAPEFAESIGIISAVSGGSVGAMYYLVHRENRSESPASPTVLTDELRHRIQDSASRSSLEGVAWGTLFPDLVRSVCPGLAPDIDRGWALESTWWNRLGANDDHRLQSQELRLRDLIPSIRQRLLPAPIFNATIVETGQRALLSPLDLRDPQDLLSGENPYQFLDRPVDFLDFYTPRGNDDGQPLAIPNPRLTTAVRLSATFSYVTPVARPSPADQRIVADLPKNSPIHERLRLHFCDGGYADNSGLVTAVTLARRLASRYELGAAPGPFRHIVILRIESFPRSEAKAAKENAGFYSAMFGPANAMFSTRESTQAERAEIELSLLKKAFDDKSHGAEANYRVALANLETLQLAMAQAATTSKEAKDLVELSRRLAPIVNDLRYRSEASSKFLSDAREKIAGLSELRSGGALASAESSPQLENVRRVVGAEFNTWSEALTGLTTELEQALARLERSIQIHSITFRFDGAAPPLSWALSPRQKQAIDDAWESVVEKLSEPDGASEGDLSLNEFVGMLNTNRQQGADEAR